VVGARELPAPFGRPDIERRENERAHVDPPLRLAGGEEPHEPELRPSPSRVGEEQGAVVVDKAEIESLDLPRFHSRRPRPEPRPGLGVLVFPPAHRERPAGRRETRLRGRPPEAVFGEQLETHALFKERGRRGEERVGDEAVAEPPGSDEGDEGGRDQGNGREPPERAFTQGQGDREPEERRDRRGAGGSLVEAEERRAERRRRGQAEHGDGRHGGLDDEDGECSPPPAFRRRASPQRERRENPHEPGQAEPERERAQGGPGRGRYP
jgi:hypothetical protein